MGLVIFLIILAGVGAAVLGLYLPRRKKLANRRRVV